MIGASSVHSAYNGSGTQGLAVTNKIHEDDGDVMSVFWNKNDTTRQLLFGSSVVQIPPSGTSELIYGSSRIFTINNDIDYVGDMYLQLTAALPAYFEDRVGYVTEFATATRATISESDTRPDGSVALTVRAKPFALQSIIERVEIQVGTQIWQTLESQDIRVVNSTELPADGFSEMNRLSSVETKSLGTGETDRTIWLVIPSLTKTLGPRLGKFANQTEDGYPIAAAPHQRFRVKVHFKEMPSFLSYLPTPVGDADGDITVIEIAEDVPFDAVIDVKDSTGSIAATGTFKPTASAGLIFAGRSGGSITACNLYAKQLVMCNEEREQMKSIPGGLQKRIKMTQNAHVTDIGTSVTKTINLDHFSLYGSHLIISGNAGTDSDGNLIRIKTAELKLNSSSFSRKLPGILLDSCTGDSLGIYSNKFIDSDNEKFTVVEYGIGTYVFPLSATAFSGSSVPLNRFDSIRLILTFTSTPRSGGSTFISVTCVGETTALFRGGSASIAMY